ncbi:MAG: CoA transferase [Deltaproteobacteria bacterium]|nr:CoA transferase [Deltaproteobacteria bacterium]
MALGDLRVLDLTRVIAGPFCTGLLADFGAEVIKVELPGRGDDTRYGYPTVADVPVAFLALNHNKKGITLDVRKPAGRELLLKLIDRCDVLVENFAAGTMEKWGLGYEVLRARHPRLIYAALSGFGQTGPYAHRTSYDIIAQAMGGLMSLTGFPDGPPTRGGGALGDYIGGLFLAVGILTAVHFRAQSGQGQLVDVSNMDAMFTILDSWPTVTAMTGRLPARLGNRHPFTAPYDCYRATDGYVVIGVANNQLFRTLVTAVGRPELGQDVRFKSPRARLEHHDEINGVIGGWVGCRTVAEVMRVLGAANVPCAPVMTVDQLLTDPQLRARDMVVQAPHPQIGPVTMPGVPIKLSASPGAVRAVGPGLGQDNEAVYRDLLGLSAAEISALQAEQVI